MPKKYIWFDGLKFTRDEDTNYYLNSAIGERLHRYIWKHYKGDIPEGYHIHHINGDRLNNDIDNLKLVKAEEHARIHGKERFENDKEWFKRFHPKGIEDAKDWHKSKEGIEWHKKQYEKTKDELHKIGNFICEHCEKEYQAEATGNNRFCSNKCKSAYRRELGIDNETRKCIVCNNKFEVNKYQKTKTCSKSCSSKLAYKNRSKKNAAS